MGHYSHLSIEEREDIMVWWRNHESISQIARKLGRNKSSISREIKRNGWTIIGVAHLCYRASTAQRKKPMFDARLARNAHYSMIQAFVHVLSFLSVVATSHLSRLQADYT